MYNGRGISGALARQSADQTKSCSSKCRKCQKQMGGVQGLTCAEIQRSPWTSNHGGGADVPHSPAT
jgi:hypothetical protein